MKKLLAFLLLVALPALAAPQKVAEVEPPREGGDRQAVQQDRREDHAEYDRHQQARERGEGRLAGAGV